MTYIKKFENEYISILENIKNIKEDSSISTIQKNELYSEELLKLGELRYKFKRLEKVYDNAKSENGEELSLNQMEQLGKFVRYFHMFNDKDSNVNTILSTNEEYGIYRYSVLHREYVDHKYLLYISGSISEDELLEEVSKHKKQTLNIISNSSVFNKSIDLCEEELDAINYEKENKRTLKYVKLFAIGALASVVAASAFSCHKNNVKDNNNTIEKNIDDKSNNKSNNDTKNETSTSKNKEDTTETKENNDKITNSKENTENSNKKSTSSIGGSSNNGSSSNASSSNSTSNNGSSSKTTTTNGGGIDLDKDKAQNGDVTITQGDGKTIAPDDSKVEGNDYVIVDDNFDSSEDKINDSVYQPDKQDTYSEDTNHKTTRPSTDKVQGSDEQKTNVNLNESSDKVNDSVNQPDKQDKTVEEKSTTTTPTIIEEDENDIEYFFVPNNYVGSNNDIYVEDFEDYDTSGYEIEEDSAYTLTLN